MLDNEVYLNYGPYRRIRRNALANILEGLKPEALHWLSTVDQRCAKYIDEENIINGDEGDDENDNDDDDEDGGKYSGTDEKDIVLNQDKRNEDDSCQIDSESVKVDCLRRLSSVLEYQFKSSYAAIRRNALHDLLETLTPAEITTLKQLCQLEHCVKDLSLEHDRFDQLLLPTNYPYIETYFDKYLTQV